MGMGLFDGGLDYWMQQIRDKDKAAQSQVATAQPPQSPPGQAPGQGSGMFAPQGQVAPRTGGYPDIDTPEYYRKMSEMFAEQMRGFQPQGGGQPQGGNWQPQPQPQPQQSPKYIGSYDEYVADNNSKGLRSAGEAEYRDYNNLPPLADLFRA